MNTRSLPVSAVIFSAIFTLQAQQDLSNVLPAIKTLPTPLSIQESLQLNYYGSAGEIPNADYDKWAGNDGEWDYNAAPSGHGYTQVDVAAISGSVAALRVQAWQYSNWTGPLIAVRGGQSGLICYAGGGDWWIHPQILAQLQETQTDDFAILKVNQLIAGASYQAIRIQRVLPESRQAAVYDLQTGLLLFKNEAVQTGHSTYASQMYYRGSRQLIPVGGGDRIPSWLKPGLTLDYQGTYTAQVLGNVPFSLPLNAQAQIQLAGDRWFYYDQTTTLASINGMPPTVEKASLVGGGNLYIAPSTLQHLQAGTLLDKDPITQAQLAVAETGNTVTLRLTVGTISSTEFSFDAASGLMTGFRSWDSTVTLYSIYSDLELVRMPDFTGGEPPRLAILRQGQRLALTGENLGTLSYTVEASEAGGPWRSVGQIHDGQPWQTEISSGKGWFLYRLRR
jgi:hypothetical protein